MAQNNDMDFWVLGDDDRVVDLEPIQDEDQAEAEPTKVQYAMGIYAIICYIGFTGFFLAWFFGLIDPIAWM